MLKLLHVFTYLFVLSISFISYALSDEYIPAEETGEEKIITIKAKPDLISSGTVYSGNNESQIATWLNTAYKTDGSVEGFYFEITGGWNPWGGEYNNADDLCGLTTVHEGSTVLGSNGEYDYINSSYKLSSGENMDELEKLSDDLQKPCWLTAGTGLYIAFFGASGYETPDIATHLKVADIACDAPYNTDKNGDGIFTIDECYSLSDTLKTNQAYYVPYKSEYITGGVRCDLSSFRNKVGADPNKIRVSECIEEINGKPINRAVFTFSAPYLYKDSKGTRVPIGEVVKFTIYDSIYSDNSGEYNIKIFKGASTERREGIFEKIMKVIENTFSVSTNTNKHIINNLNIILATTNINNYNDFNLSLTNKAYASNEEELYQKKVGLIKTFYNYIVRDSIFTNTIRILLALYISFFGLNFAMGALQYNVKDAMNLLLKLTFILVFTMPSGWDLYNEYVVTFFLKALMFMVTSIINIINKIVDPLGYIYIPEGTSLSSIFVNMDSVIFYLITDTIGKRILALICGHGLGFLIALAIIFSIVNTIVKLTTAAFPIIISYIEIMLGLMLGPIFISFYLFKSTESIFMNWLSFIGSRCANIFFTATILLIFMEIIKAQYKDLFNFSIYTKNGWELGAMKVLLFVLGWMSYGILPKLLKKIEWIVYVPDYTGVDSYNFWGIMFKIFGLNIIIQLFSVITKHLPAVVDSLVEIKGGKGGKMKDTVGNENLLQAADKAVNSGFNRKSGSQFFGYIDRYTNFSGALLGVGKGAFGYFKDKYKDRPDKKEEKERNKKSYLKSKLMGISLQNDDKFKDLFSKKNEEKVDKLVQSIRKGEKNVSFSDDPEENRKFHELRKNYILMKNEEDFGKYIRNDRVDIRAFLKDHKGISNEDREMLIDSITTQINLNTDFDYYERTQELADRLANFDPDKASDKEAEKLRKDLEELQRFRNDIEDLLALRSGQGPNTTEFLMSGVDLDRFGLSGAKNFTAIAGINASSFLGFNNGAANIASGMGIQLVEEDEYADDKDDDKKKILAMKNVNAFQMNNSLVYFLTTKINEKRSENEKLRYKHEIQTKEEQQTIDRNDGEIRKLLKQRTKAQKRVYESANSNSLLDALENLTAKSNNPNLSEDKKLDITDSRNLLIKELKDRCNSEWLDSEEIDRFNQIFDKESNKDEFEEETKTLKKVGKSKKEINKKIEDDFAKEQQDLADEYNQNFDMYRAVKEPGIINSTNRLSAEIGYRKNKIEQLQSKDHQATKFMTFVNNASIKHKEQQLAKKEQEVKELKAKENADDYMNDIIEREDYIRKKQEQIEKLKARNQKASKLRVLTHKLGAKYQKYRQDKQIAALRYVESSKRYIDIERTKQKQRLQDIQNIKTSREELFKIEENKKILEVKRDKYIEMLKLNEQAKAKNSTLLLDTISNNDRSKLQQNCKDITQKNIELRNKIEEYNRKLFEQTKFYQMKEKELNLQNKMFVNARNQDKKQNEKELSEIRLRREQIAAKLNKAKDTKQKEILQKEIEILSNHEKYYLKEEELRNKSIEMLQKQEQLQLKQQKYRIAEATDNAIKEVDKESKSLIVKGINSDRTKQTNGLMEEKLSELKKIDEQIKAQGEKPELLEQKKNIDLDLQIISIRQKIDNSTDMIAKAKEINMQKLNEAKEKAEEASKILNSLNKRIEDETNNEHKKILIKNQKQLQENILKYQKEQEEYEHDIKEFKNKQNYLDMEKQKLQNSYATSIFEKESKKNTDYILIKQELVKAHENKKVLEIKSKELQDESEVNVMLKNEQDRKIDEAIKAGNTSVERVATEEKLASSVELLAKQTLLKWDAKKNREALEKQKSDIEKIEKTLEHIENTPALAADTAGTYKEKSLDIKKQTLNAIEKYCQKYLNIDKDTFDKEISKKDN